MDKEKIGEIKHLMADNGINHRGMTGETLKVLRLCLNLTQTEMGGKLGISRDAVAKLEGGKNKMSRPVEMLAIKLASELE